MVKDSLELFVEDEVSGKSLVLAADVLRTVSGVYDVTVGVCKFRLTETSSSVEIKHVNPEAKIVVFCLHTFSKTKAELCAGNALSRDSFKRVLIVCRDGIEASFVDTYYEALLEDSVNDYLVR